MYENIRYIHIQQSQKSCYSSKIVQALLFSFFPFFFLPFFCPIVIFIATLSFQVFNNIFFVKNITLCILVGNTDLNKISQQEEKLRPSGPAAGWFYGRKRETNKNIAVRRSSQGWWTEMGFKECSKQYTSSICLSITIKRFYSGHKIDKLGVPWS